VKELIDDFFAAHPHIELWALGAGAHRSVVDLEPFGVPARFVAAESSSEVVNAYFAFNRNAFSGDLQLPGWVLTDLYMLPGIVGLLVGPLDGMEPQWPLSSFDGGKRIMAAYYAAPSLEPGLLVGVSLISAVSGLSAGPIVKALTLKMNRAARVRGVSRWEERPIRAHVKVGPLWIVSRTPGPHERAARSFVYETLLGDAAGPAALLGSLHLPITERHSIHDLAALDTILGRAESGEKIAIVPPGVDDERMVCLSHFE